MRALIHGNGIMIFHNGNSFHAYSMKEQPFGKTWAEWTTRWWQWFLSIPKELHPFYDVTGERSDAYQENEDVIFLVGTTYGGIHNRCFRVSRGKAILFPVINFTISYAEDPRLRTEAEMISYAQSNVDDIVRKEANIDGVDLVISEEDRMRTPPFGFSFPKENIYGVKDGPTIGVADGYWIFLKPFSVGTHRIRAFGSCLSGKIQITVNVDLVIDE